MIFRRILFALLAASLISTGAAVAVISLAFAVFALVQPRLGSAGAAAVVAGAAALLVLLVGLSVALASRRSVSKAPPTVPAGFLETALAFLSQKPVMAAATALGGVAMAIRNPKYLGVAIRAFLDGDPGRR